MTLLMVFTIYLHVSLLNTSLKRPAEKVALQELLPSRTWDVIEACEDDKPHPHQGFNESTLFPRTAGFVTCEGTKVSS